MGGANRGVGWAGGRSGAEVGPTQEGQVDPVHGQRRKVAENNKVKEREEGEKEYILIGLHAKLHHYITFVFP